MLAVCHGRGRRHVLLALLAVVVAEMSLPDHRPVATIDPPQFDSLTRGLRSLGLGSSRRSYGWRGAPALELIAAVALPASPASVTPPSATSAPTAKAPAARASLQVRHVEEDGVFPDDRCRPGPRTVRHLERPRNVLGRAPGGGQTGLGARAVEVWSAPLRPIFCRACGGCARQDGPGGRYPQKPTNESLFRIRCPKLCSSP